MKKPIILLILTFLCGGNALAKDKYFSLVKVLNTTNGITTATVTLTESKKTCSTHLKGAAEGNKEFGGLMKTITSKCIRKLTPEYLKAFNNKTIKNVMYISYTNIIWPSRVIMYGIEKSWLSKQGCSIIVKNYKSIDKNAICIYG